jgi:hypothetical protein
MLCNLGFSLLPLQDCQEVEYQDQLSKKPFLSLLLSKLRPEYLASKKCTSNNHISLDRSKSSVCSRLIASNSFISSTVSVIGGSSALCNAGLLEVFPKSDVIKPDDERFGCRSSTLLRSRSVWASAKVIQAIKPSTDIDLSYSISSNCSCS